METTCLMMDSIRGEIFGLWEYVDAEAIREQVFPGNHKKTK